MNSVRQRQIKYKFFKNILKLLKSYLFGCGLIVVIVMVIIFPLDLIVTKYLHFESIKELIHQTQKKYDKYPLYLTVFIGPFIEEVLFRLSLVINKRNISVFLGLLLHEMLRRTFVHFNFQSRLYLYIIIVSITVFLISWKYLTPKIIEYLEDRKKVLALFSIILFGLVHIINIKVLYWELAFFYPFFVLPQMIMGYFITDLRLKCGFLWGLSLHSIFNFIAIVL